MPHCIIEYTSDVEKDVDIKNLIDVAYDSLVESELFNNSAIKARARRIELFRSGLDRNDYIHITLRILPGRSDEQKSLASTIMLKNISPLVKSVKSLSVEVVDLHGPSYAKRLI